MVELSTIYITLHYYKRIITVYTTTIRTPSLVRDALELWIHPTRMSVVSYFLMLALTRGVVTSHAGHDTGLRTNRDGLRDSRTSCRVDEWHATDHPSDPGHIV